MRAEPAIGESLSRFDVALACAGLAVTTYVLITTLIIVHNSYTPLPFEDSWREWQRYLLYGKYSAFLFSEHNEHRIAVPRLFFMIDRYVFQARNVFPLVCSLLFQAGTVVWLYRMARRTGKFSPLSRVLLGCAICSALFSAQQFPNLVEGFQIQFTVLYCCVCGSILALLKAAEGSRPEVWFAVSCACALAATYSSANGLLSWPLLLLLAPWLRLPLKYRFSLVVGMILVTGVYMWGYYTPPGHSRPLEELTQRLPGVLIRAASFLGSPTDAVYAVLARLFGLHTAGSRIVLASAFGAVGMAGAFWGLMLVWRRRERFTTGHAALVHVALFVILTAGLVGLGRATFPITSAMDARYKSHALVFWIALGAFYWQFVEQRLTAQRLEVVFHSAVVLIIAGLAPIQLFWLPYSRDFAATNREIEAAIVADVFDEPVWKKSYPFPPYGLAIVAPIDYLRHNRLSIFTEAWTTWTGQPVDSLFTVDHVNVCEGSFDAATPIVSPIKPGWRLSGQAWAKPRRSGPGMVILVDAVQRISGVVRADVGGRWSGYVAGSEPRKLTAYLLEQDARSLCFVGISP